MKKVRFKMTIEFVVAVTEEPDHDPNTGQALPMYSNINMVVAKAIQDGVVGAECCEVKLLSAKEGK